MKFYIVFSILFMHVILYGKDIDIFQKYHTASIYNGIPKTPKYNSDSMDLLFYKSIKKVASSPVDFAGCCNVFQVYSGGGSISAYIIDTKEGKLYSFPDDYEGAGNIDFEITYKVNSSAICITGISANDDTVYNNQCYNFQQGEFFPIN